MQRHRRRQRSIILKTFFNSATVFSIRISSPSPPRSNPFSRMANKFACWFFADIFQQQQQLQPQICAGNPLSRLNPSLPIFQLHFAKVHKSRVQSAPASCASSAAEPYPISIQLIKHLTNCPARHVDEATGQEEASRRSIQQKNCHLLTQKKNRKQKAKRRKIDNATRSTVDSSTMRRDHVDNCGNGERGTGNPLGALSHYTHS